MTVGLVLVVGGVAAGVFGSLLGLGGGILIVPLLTLGFGRPIREAVAVSLVCVIVTSSAAAGAYLKGRVANLRLGTVLALFTTAGALVGGLLAFVIPERYLAGLFALLLVYVALSMGRAGLKVSRAPTDGADPVGVTGTDAAAGPGAADPGPEPADPGPEPPVRDLSPWAASMGRATASGGSCPPRSPRWERE